MKKVLKYLAQVGINAEPAEVRRAYKRESAQFGITADSPRQIAKYLHLNNLTR